MGGTEYGTRLVPGGKIMVAALETLYINKRGSVEGGEAVLFSGSIEGSRYYCEGGGKYIEVS